MHSLIDSSCFANIKHFVAHKSTVQFWMLNKFNGLSSFYPRDAICSSPVSVHVCHKSTFYRRDGPIDLVFGLQASFNQSRSISFTVLAPPSLTAVVYNSDRRDSMILLRRSVSDS